MVEVLVIASTLAIVIALLAPAASGANSQSIVQTELNVLRNLLNTAAIYASRDPKNVFGPVHPLHNNFNGEGYAEYGGGPGNSPFTDWGDAFDPRTRPFNKLIYGLDSQGLPTEPSTSPGDRSVYKEFQCLGNDLGWQKWPSLNFLEIETEAPYFAAAGTSFRMNNLSYVTEEIAGIYGRPTNLIPSPSATLAFFEARVFQTVFTNDTWGLSTTHGELAGYHKKLGYFVTGYVDGHAAFVDMGNGTFFPRLPEYSSQDVRGTWGRMDCYPARNTFSD